MKVGILMKVGIVGCGSIARFRHAPEYTECDGVEIAGYYDPNTERAQALAKDFGGRVYASFEDLIHDGSIQAVSICSANIYHKDMTIQALKAGKHVLCEKPMATTADDAAEMVKVAGETGRLLMVGHNQRFHPAHQKAKQLLEQGCIGQILSIDTHFSHQGPETWSADKGKNTWFFDKKIAALGALGDLGIHKIDLLQWLADDEISEVFACVDTLDKRDAAGALISVEDNARCTVRTRKKGILGTVLVSWTCYGDEDNSTTIYGTKGTMEIFRNKDFALVLSYADGSKEYHQVGRMQTNTEQTNTGIINAFVQAILDNSASPVSGADACKTLRVIEACFQSSAEGRRVSL